MIVFLIKKVDKTNFRKMENITQFFNLMGLPATPTNIELFINTVDEAIDAGRMQKIQRIPKGESFYTAMARKYRPTTNSQEEEFSEQQRELESGEKWKPEEGEWIYYVDENHGRFCCLPMKYFTSRQFLIDNPERIKRTKEEAMLEADKRNTQREAAETSEPDSGKDGNVTPAGPLRVMPKNNQWVWVVSFEEPNEAIYPVAHQFDRDCVISINLFQAGLCFPDTPSGRLGAELRAKMGILPPIDREGHGVFVPESEIEKLSIAVDGGYLSDLPFIIRSFLKAIDKEGGQNE